jgi:SAM-dependent methyltransferase
MGSDDAAVAPDWLRELFGLPTAGRVVLGGEPFVFVDGLWRAEAVLTSTQEQTSQTFGFKWAKRDTFESDAFQTQVVDWLLERYGPVADAAWWEDYGQSPLVVDAGCGAGMSALALFGDRLADVRYLGIDVSTAVDVARDRFADRGLRPGLLQADLGRLPLTDRSADVVFSEGVLHHTDSTEQALYAVARLLRPGGRLLFYVYRRKGPIREFTDDYVRGRVQELTPEQAWEALLPLSELGRVLGELHVEVEVPVAVDLLEIPAGRIDLQRLFYWHVCKMFYGPEMTLDEMNHINFDWFAPANAHRQSVEEVTAWCANAGLAIEREVIQEAGITIVARREG